MAEPEILTQQQHGEDERDGTAAETKDSRDIQPTVSQEEKEDPDAFVNNGAFHDNLYESSLHRNSRIDWLPRKLSSPQLTHNIFRNCFSFLLFLPFPQD